MNTNAFFNFKHQRHTTHYISIYVQRGNGGWTITDMVSIHDGEVFVFHPSEYKLFFKYGKQWDFIGMETW